MARPRRANIFEVMLPDTLPPAEQWLYEYHSNCLTLVTYLETNGAKSTAYYGAIKCLCRLREYLLNHNLPYSFEKADKWFQDISTAPKGYEITLSRLYDIYRFGDIQPIHAFPYAIPYSENLNEYWGELLSLFTFSLDGSSGQNYIHSKTTIAARFLYGLQKRGLTHVCQINFDVLEEYCDNDFHESHTGDALYTYVIGDVLRVLSEYGYCRVGLGWYPYFRMHDRIMRIDELSSDHRIRIEEVRDLSQEFSGSDYAVLIPAFLKELESCEYSTTIIMTSRFVLNNLLLFLEMNDLGYHPIIAEIWLEYARTKWQATGWKQFRRTLSLFDDFTKQNGIDPGKIFRYKPLRLSSLPRWCLQELEAFLLQKQKEGWENSSICMYRSSITRFCEFLVSEGVDSFRSLTPEMIKKYNRTDHHKNPEAKNAYNSRIRRFLQYLERKEVITYGIHCALYSHAAPKESIVVVLTEEEKETIHQYGLTAQTPIELRDFAILLTGLLMGLRSIDIVQLKISDIDWHNQSIRVLQEKTDYEIELPMPTEVGNAIYRYLKYGRHNTDCPNVFIKNRVPYDSVGRHTCLKAINKVLDLPDGVGFHITRRTFATDQLIENTDMHTLINLLGQRDTSSLNQYLLLNEEMMRMCPISMDEAGIPFRGTRYD